MHQRNGQAQWAVLGDGRIRQVGHLIRKTRLDELPQVINRVRVCLCGERSTLITRSVNITKSSIVCGHCSLYRILLTTLVGLPMRRFNDGGGICG
jgi:lipopolysaccharide/colanic/teichoic acid biosynthesis glycosyltransferase